LAEALKILIINHREFLGSLKVVQEWIVEISHFAVFGKVPFEGPTVLLKSVIQYLEKPYEWVKKFNSHKFPNAILDQNLFCEVENDNLTVQNVPEAIYNASYPCRFLGVSKFLKPFNYSRLQATFESFCVKRMITNSTSPGIWLGFHFILK
jgi:hypothetical protein